MANGQFLWLSYNVRPTSISISYDTMSIFSVSLCVESLVMRTIMSPLIGRVRRIRDAAVNWQQSVLNALADPYRPEMHYMRAPGPKWRQKHPAWPNQ
jgi:hypothetical protein